MVQVNLLTITCVYLNVIFYLFRLIRGVNNLGIETAPCDWAVPKDIKA